MTTLLLWMRLLLAGPVCLLVVEDWIGPELPNRAHGPGAVDDVQTGFECHILNFD